MHYTVYTKTQANLHFDAFRPLLMPSSRSSVYRNFLRNASGKWFHKLHRTTSSTYWPAVIRSQFKITDAQEQNSTEVLHSYVIRIKRLKVKPCNINDVENQAHLLMWMQWHLFQHHLVPVCVGACVCAFVRACVYVRTMYNPHLGAVK